MGYNIVKKIYERINDAMKYILASASPRRKEILENIGLDFTVITSDADETCDISDPEELTKELSRRKGTAVYEQLINNGTLENDTVIISSDTVVACDGEILGKPRDKADAERMIRMLSGKAHTVTSGVALIYNGNVYTDAATTKVFFDELDEDFINSYINSPEPYDKAGAYAIQGKACEVISRIDGCYFNVVGLPVNCLLRLAKKNNIPLILG